MLSTTIKPNTIRNILTRRSLHMTSAARSEGSAGAKPLNEREKAAETKWAREHDAQLLDKLKKSLAEQEKTTSDIKAKLAELEAKKK